MSERPQKTSGRPRRGRPDAGRSARRRAESGPTAARLIAVRVLERVERARAFADLSLHHALARSTLAGRDRALATELVFGTLRWRGHLDFLLGHFLDRKLDRLEPLVASTLRMGAYQLVFTDRIPETAAVDQAVRCARALGAERATGLVNAVLRKLASGFRAVSLPALESDPVGHLQHVCSLPEWIAVRWQEIFGAEQAAALATACNAPPPLTVRVNRLRCTPHELLAELRPRFPEARRCRFSQDGLVLGFGGDPGRDPAFLDGRFTVQDEGSQLVLDMLDPQPGDFVLDACAAPGTKTTGIAERTGARGDVLAIDRHARRLSLVGRAARRLGLEGVRTLERDATRALSDLAGERGFDRVLVDAPCSGLGALRRNPDARWRVRPEDPRDLHGVQLAILNRAAAVLRPGGGLVYSTCTVLPEENETLVEAFLAANRSFRLVPRAELPPELAPLLGDEGMMRSLPHLHDCDGFFAVRLERKT